MTPYRIAEIDGQLSSVKPDLQALLKQLRSYAEMAPNDSATLYRLGQCHLLRGEWEQGTAALMLASAASPGDAGLKLALADALGQGGAGLAALRCYDRALELAPDTAAALFGRAQGRHLLCQVDEALADYTRTIELLPDAPQPRSFKIVAMNYREAGQAVILAETKAYANKLTEVSLRMAKPPGSTKLKVGFLSADFREHSVSYFLEPLLRRIPEDCQVLLYHDSIHRDHVTELFSRLAHEVCYVAGASNEVLVEKMRNDQLSTAVDLGGHFSRQRLQVFAARVAPTQISYLGYPNTTGVPAMDWRLGDEVIDKFQGSVDDWTERLHTLPCMFAYAPPSDAPAPAPSPEKPVFGYFGHLGKISPEVAVAWNKILDLVPDSRLLIKGDALGDATTAAYWRKRLSDWGLSQERVDFEQKTVSRFQHLSMYSRVSVTLDTWPYNGTTTIFESLWMGVPVVALLGSRHASRVSAGILARAKQPTYSSTVQGYVEIAQELALSKIRISRGSLAKAAWFDHDTVARDFWQALDKLSKKHE